MADGKPNFSPVDLGRALAGPQAPRIEYTLSEDDRNHEVMRRATEIQLSREGGRMNIKSRDGTTTTYDYPGTSYPNN
jgi:hypothetical protein